jgi:hypothetical protein
VGALITVGLVCRFRHLRASHTQRFRQRLRSANHKLEGRKVEVPRVACAFDISYCAGGLTRTWRASCKKLKMTRKDLSDIRCHLLFGGMLDQTGFREQFLKRRGAIKPSIGAYEPQCVVPVAARGNLSQDCQYLAN